MKKLIRGGYLVSIFSPLIIVSNILLGNETYPLIFIGMVYNLYMTTTLGKDPVKDCKKLIAKLKI